MAAGGGGGKGQFPAEVYSERFSATSYIQPPASGARQAWLIHSAALRPLGSQDDMDYSCWTNVYLSRNIHSFHFFKKIPYLGILSCSPGVFPFKWKKMPQFFSLMDPSSIILVPVAFKLL